MLFICLTVFYIILVSHLKSSKIEWAVNKIKDLRKRLLGGSFGPRVRQGLQQNPEKGPAQRGSGKPRLWPGVRGSCDEVALGDVPQVLEGISNTLEEVQRYSLDPTVRLEEAHLLRL